MLIGLSLSGITRLAHKTITAKNIKSKGTIRQLEREKNKIINSGYTYMMGGWMGSLNMLVQRFIVSLTIGGNAR